MMYVILPAPLRPRPNDPFLYNFLDCAVYLLDNEELFMRPASNIRAAQRILTAIEDAVAEKKTYVALTDDDYSKLKAVFDNPTSGYGAFSEVVKDENDKVLGQVTIKVPPRTFLPFIDAVVQVKTSPPPPPPPVAAVEVVEALEVEAMAIPAAVT